MSVRFIGGDKTVGKIPKLLKSKQNYKGYDVGFLSGQYANGTNVAQVAMFNEFGTQHIPERPFFRNANKKVTKKLISLIKTFLNIKENYVLSKIDIERMALLHQAEIQQSIVDLRDPPNVISTIKAKRSSNPLIDTGKMRQSVTYKVVDK